MKRTIMILAVAVMARSAELDNKTLNHKLIMGYQGWFACPGDGRPDGNWVHWFTRGKATARTTTVDLLPDVSELDPDERCKTPFMSRAGHPIEVFSSQNPKTVMRHFRWMKEYGIDGVALQRFIVGLRPDHVAISDRVLDNVRRAAEANGRGFFIMYDVAGADSQTWAAQMEEDWRRLQAEGITRGPAYLSHRGHPVVAIAGFGSEENRPPTPVTGAACLARMREISKAYGGVTLFGTLPGSWRKAEDWASVYRSFDVVSPWTVGRFADNAGADRDRKNILAPDLAEARQLGIDYMPVVFPGFSWLNLMTVRGQTEERHSVSNQIRRNCGDFYWHQVENAVQEGATMLYGAMFDEVDEGTAMFKIVANRKDLPDSPPFVPLDADGCALPSDWYLQLASKTAAMLHGELKPSGKLPLAVPGERK